MKLHEFQTKAIFKREGIPLPASFLSASPAQARQAASEIGYPVILKAQSLLSGRGKAGGIRLSKTDEETEKAASDILSIQLKGISIQNILVEKAIKVEDELFMGFFYDPNKGDPSFALSVDGGLSLENSLTLPESSTYIQSIKPILGLQLFMVRDACAHLAIDPAQWKSIEQIAMKLWQVFNQYDATLAEINSMVFDSDGHAIVLDGKLIIDDNALYRQREFVGYLDPAITSFAQAEARKFGHQLVRMEGNIAVVTNGQGLAGATVDTLKRYGLKPGLIMILRHNATKSSIAAVCQLINNDSSVRAVLINIFGYMNDGVNIAQGILTGCQTCKTPPYFMVLNGVDYSEAKTYLQEHGESHLDEHLENAIHKLVQALEENDVDSH